VDIGTLCGMSKNGFMVRVRVRVLGLWLALGLGHSRVLARCDSGLDTG